MSLSVTAPDKLEQINLLTDVTQYQILYIEKEPQLMN